MLSNTKLVPYCETRYAKQGNLQKYANQSRIARRFSDVCIQTGNISFPAHRLVLSCYSQFFDRFFSSQMYDQYQGTVELNELDGNSVSSLINFMYTRSITIEYKNVFDVLATAHFFQMNEVCEFCFDYLRTTVTIDNWHKILSSCLQYRNDSFLKELYQFISKNIHGISQSKNFKDLKVEELTSLMQNLNESITAEISVYEAFFSWIRHDETNRESELLRFLLLLDLQKLPCEFLGNVVASNPLVRRNVDCLNVVLAAIAQQLENRKIKKRASKLVSIGGFKTRSKVAEVYSDAIGESNTAYPDVPHQMIYDKALQMKKSIYNIGGSSDLNFEVVSNQVYRLKDTELKWEEIASMNKERAVLAAAVFKDCIVVAGGVSGKKSRMRSSEVYIPALNKWILISDMNELRSGAELIECDGSLYALGGTDGQQILSTVEQLSDLEDSKWKVTEPMKFSRGMFAAVSYKGEIYVFGGLGGKNTKSNNAPIPLKSVEKFSPTDKIWTSVSDMKKERLGHTACLLGDKIFLVGGEGRNKKGIKFIECYDPSTDKWTEVGEAEDEFVRHSLIPL